ncbi:MAG TPA: signal peptidase I [Candidatus Hydrogenedentes bacterium]|nr:signal peptidase I [Candidatus Hydrogenedentota bacterium]
MKTALEWLLLIALVLLFKAIVADHYLIPTDSMEPTLKGNPDFFRGDHVLVDKITYGIRIPGTSRWLIRWRPPARGEIVVFFSAYDPKQPVQIKRTAALPGEQVLIKNGSLFINGSQIRMLDEEGRPIHYSDRLEPDEATLCGAFLALARENRLPDVLNPDHPPVQALWQAIQAAHEAALQCDPKHPEQDKTCRALCDQLTPAVRNTLRHLVLHQAPPLRYALTPIQLFTRVPDQSVFLLGDNSPESIDGRAWGFTPTEHVFGQAVLVWRPPFSLRLLVASPLHSPGLILTGIAVLGLLGWFAVEAARLLRRLRGWSSRTSIPSETPT